MKLRSGFVFFLLLLLVQPHCWRKPFAAPFLEPSRTRKARWFPGAKVTVHNINTGLQRTTQTSADGSYSVPELPVGTYTVTVTQTGFQTAVTSNVAVDVAWRRDAWT